MAIVFTNDHPRQWHKQDGAFKVSLIEQEFGGRCALVIKGKFSKDDDVHIVNYTGDFTDAAEARSYGDDVLQALGALRDTVSAAWVERGKSNRPV